MPHERRITIAGSPCMQAVHCVSSLLAGDHAVKPPCASFAAIWSPMATAAESVTACRPAAACTTANRAPGLPADSPNSGCEPRARADASLRDRADCQGVLAGGRAAWRAWCGNRGRMRRGLMNEARAEFADPQPVDMHGRAHGARQPLLQIVEPLLLLAEARSGMRLLQRASWPLSSLRLDRAQLAPHAGARRAERSRQSFQASVAIRCYQLGCAGRSGRARIGGKIGDREINLVPDAGDDRDARGADRARHALVVERPEILERATAARHDQDVAFGSRRSQSAWPRRSTRWRQSPCTGVG